MDPALSTAQGEGELTTTIAAPDDAAPDLSPPLIVGGGVFAIALIAILAWSFLGRRVTPPPLLEDRPEIEAPVGAPVAQPVPVRDDGLVGRMRAALGRTRSALRERLDAGWAGTIDQAALENLEEVLLGADVGPVTTERLLEPLREQLRRGENDATVLRDGLRAQIRALLAAQDPALVPMPEAGPWVLLVVGVNGSGKTTTIGKLAARLGGQGKRVLIAAGDTYRAAAAEQLKVWADRAGADFVAGQEGGDPGAVVYDALEKARARGHDVVIIDTAGRLQTVKPLMEQLSKIRRVIARQVPEAPHETLLVLDGTMGQNGLSQARLFHEATPLTGVVVTKLDGTAKGGMVLAITSELGLPVKLVGIGEKIEDLADFDPAAFAAAVA